MANVPVIYVPLQLIAAVDASAIMESAGTLVAIQGTVTTMDRVICANTDFVYALPRRNAERLPGDTNPPAAKPSM
jgi:hypothetical protein